MNRYFSTYKLFLLSLLALLVVAFVMMARTASLIAPPLQRAAVAGEAAPSAAGSDQTTTVHPADRKFTVDGYAIYRSAPDSSYAFDTVHPADRKFFYSLPANNPFAAESLHPADRKFFTPGYGMSSGAEPSDPLGDVHPADRKFLDAGHCWDVRDCAGSSAVQ